MYKQVKRLSSYTHYKIKRSIEYDFHTVSTHYYDQLLLEIDCLEKSIMQMQETIASTKTFQLFNNASQKLAISREAINVLADLKQTILTLQYSVTNLKINTLFSKNIQN